MSSKKKLNRFINADEIVVRQRRMSMPFYVTVLIVMMTVQWMTVDMYLPALPVLKAEFNASEALLNMSLNSDLILCAIGTLIGGTLSDKYGRNPIMIIGLVIASIALFLGAVANGVVVLIITRGLTGLGGGLALTVSNAIVRDSFSGETFKKVTTLAQAAAIAGPIIAPAIGAFLIEYLSWRWIFIVLGVGTLLTLIPFLIATETWPRERRVVSSVWQATKQALNLVKNIEYSTFVTYMVIITIPVWAYLAVCSYVYYDEFGVSNIEYSLLYAAGSVSGFIGPIIYIKLARLTTGRRTLEVIMGMNVLTLILFFLIGVRGPVLFMFAVVPTIMAEAMTRSMGLVVVLEEYPKEAGAVSSVTGFAFLIVSIIGTTLATLPWPTMVMGLVVTTAIVVVAMLILWVIILKKKVYYKQLKG